jgi:hypothetical protein
MSAVNYRAGTFFKGVAGEGLEIHGLKNLVGRPWWGLEIPY